MERNKLFILCFLLILSALLSAGLAMLLTPLAPIIIIALALFIFLCLFLIFDNLLWRFWPFSGVPNIHGEWVGRLSSSYQNNSEIEPFRIYIIQRWISTRVDFIGKESTSSSYASVLYRDENGQYILAYIYRAEARSGKEDKFMPHIGLTVMRLVEPKRFSGYYHHLDTDEDGLGIIQGQLVWTRE